MKKFTIYTFCKFINLKNQVYVNFEKYFNKKMTQMMREKKDRGGERERGGGDGGETYY